jgi:hypothetical protein
MIRVRSCDVNSIDESEINLFKSSSDLNESENDSKAHVINLNESKKKSHIYACSYCKMEFSTSSNMTRHITNICKVLKSQDNEKEEIYQTLLKEIKEMHELIKKQGNELELLKSNKNKNTSDTTDTTNSNNNTSTSNSNNTLNNNSNNKIVNNLVINAFGQEDLSHLTNKDYKELFYSSSKSVPNLISKIHFNRKKPSNSNVYISNLKDSYVMVYDGENWNMLLKNDIIDELFDSKIIHLEGKYEEQLSKLDKTVKKRFDRFLFNIEHSSIEHDIKKEVKLLLYNSRVLALKNKKANEQNQKEILAK